MNLFVPLLQKLFCSGLFCFLKSNLFSLYRFGSDAMKYIQTIYGNGLNDFASKKDLCRNWKLHTHYFCFIWQLIWKCFAWVHIIWIDILLVNVTWMYKVEFLYGICESVWRDPINFKGQFLSFRFIELFECLKVVFIWHLMKFNATLIADIFIIIHFIFFISFAFSFRKILTVHLKQFAYY